MRKSELLATELKSRLESGTWYNDGVLPTVREIAGEFAFSAPTVIAALKSLRTEGVIRRLPFRNRYIAALATAPDFSSPASPTRHLRLARQIKEEILSCRLSAENGGVLPMMKSLKSRFHCSHGTLQKALEVLVREHVVEEHARGYRLIRQTEPPLQSHVYFACSPSIVFKPRGDVLLLVNAIENEIARRNWPNLRHCLADDFTEDKLPPDHMVSGYIYLSNRAANLAPLLRTRKRHIPLVRIDPEERNRAGYEAMKLYFCLSPDNHYAGRTVGMHLQTLGHRHCVFLSHSSLDVLRWAARRLSGLTEVFPQGAGGPRTCTVISQQGTSGQITPAAGRLSDSLARAHGVLNRACPWGRAVTSGVLSAAWEALASLRLGIELEDTFREALRLEKVTAWVCASDQIAIAAKTFLDQCGERRARSIALVGFDNSPLSYSLGITSYDFDYAAIGKLAVSCLESPGHMLSIAPERSLLVKGNLVVRRSTSP